MAGVTKRWFKCLVAGHHWHTYMLTIVRPDTEVVEQYGDFCTRCGKFT